MLLYSPISYLTVKRMKQKMGQNPEQGIIDEDKES